MNARIKALLTSIVNGTSYRGTAQTYVEATKRGFIYYIDKCVDGGYRITEAGLAFLNG